MPVYTYHCNSCQHTFEDTHKVSDREIPFSQPCPSCNETGKVVIHLGKTLAIDAGRLGRLKPRSDFRERMTQIKKKMPHNKIPNY